MEFKALFPPTYDGTCYLEITHKCNYKCKHCYVNAPNDLEMSLDKIKQLAKILEKYKFKKIVITGGEPLVVKHLGKAIEVLSKKMKVILVTNGVLIKERFEEVKNWNFSGAYISLDGLDEDDCKNLRKRKGLKDTIEGINLLKSINKKMNIGIILTKYNADKIEEMITKIEDLGVSGINLSLTQPFGRTLKNKDMIISPKEYSKKYLPKLIKLHKKHPKLHFESVLCFPDNMKNNSKKVKSLSLFEKYISGCAAGKKFIYIRPDGKVMPCGYITGDKELVKYLDNIFEKSLEEIYKGKMFKFFINRSWESVKGKCKACDHNIICKGGCPFRSYYIKKDIQAPDPWCLNNPLKNNYLRPIGVNENNFEKTDKILNF